MDYWRARFLYFSYRRQRDDSFGDGCRGYGCWRRQQSFYRDGLYYTVVAANAGGAFSPFGDITTLMLWQKGMVEFTEFFSLLVPSIANWLVPAAIMSVFLPKGHPEGVAEEIKIKQGGIVVIFLFLGTIALAVVFHSALHLPSMVGMMTELGVLKLYGYYLKRATGSEPDVFVNQTSGHDVDSGGRFDIFDQLQRVEWDTLMFFYGVVLCVGGLSAFGYLNLASVFMYEEMGASWANILVGLLSAIVDNIPVMFSVLTMLPDMSVNQWLLVTLTAGVGGSLLSWIGCGRCFNGSSAGHVHIFWALEVDVGNCSRLYRFDIRTLPNFGYAVLSSN